MSEQNHKHRWAIILAGGDGTRLKLSLWNTFVMVGHLEAFLEIIFRTLPGLYRTLLSTREALGSATEEQVLKRLYSEIVSENFSKEVLAQRPGDLSVLQLSGVRWTDLGEPQRVVSTLQSNQFYQVYDRTSVRQL